MSFSAILTVLCMILEAILVILLLYRRVWKELPIFCIYGVWSLVSDLGMYVAVQIWGSASEKYSRFYQAGTATSWVVDFLVLVELGLVIFRRGSVFEGRDPRWIVTAGLGLLGWLSWEFAGLTEVADLSLESVRIFQIHLAMACLAVAAMICLAVYSKVFSIQWKGLERKVGWGLATLGLTGVLLNLINSQIPSRGSYDSSLGRLVVIFYLGVLVYWIIGLTKYPRNVAPEN